MVSSRTAASQCVNVSPEAGWAPGSGWRGVGGLVGVAGRGTVTGWRVVSRVGGGLQAGQCGPCLDLGASPFADRGAKCVEVASDCL